LESAVQKKTKVDSGVLLLGHGSRVAEANDPLRDVARAVERRWLGGECACEPAFLQFEKPDFQEAVERLASRGVGEIVVMPYFLYMGNHVRQDIPSELEAARARYPQINFTVADNLGYHRSLVDITLERISAAVKPGGHVKPPAIHPIEKESFDIISTELDESAFSHAELPIIKRVIHATADYDFAKILSFSPGAIEAGIRALRAGADIITDVRMIEAGISAGRLAFLGPGRVRCFSSDADVAAMAERENITKTAASMRKAAEFLGGAVAVIGNAPTALNELLSLAAENKTAPALIIGVPVGFVGAVEAKDALMKSGREHISTIGRKGGSTVAVAIVNALLMEAGKRGRDGSAC
jgi:precorrin-8X/cobalt-precorrin-8 methylmutase